MATTIPTDPAHVSLQEWQRLLRDWHERKYGGRPPEVIATFAKVGEEMGELAGAFRHYVQSLGKGQDEANDNWAMRMAEEAVDVSIVLHHLVRGLGLDLAQEMLRKLQVIHDRLDLEDRARDAARAGGVWHPAVCDNRPPGRESPLSPTWHDVDTIDGY